MRFHILCISSVYGVDGRREFFTCDYRYRWVSYGFVLVRLQLLQYCPISWKRTPYAIGFVHKSSIWNVRIDAIPTFVRSRKTERQREKEVISSHFVLHSQPKKDKCNSKRSTEQINKNRKAIDHKKNAQSNNDNTRMCNKIAFDSPFLSSYLLHKLLSSSASFVFRILMQVDTSFTGFWFLGSSLSLISWMSWAE